MKATAVAPSNLAFVKYWGARDVERAIPRHPSVSMTLDRCCSRCTVETTTEGEDEVLIVGEDGSPRPAPEAFAEPVRRHVERLRREAGGGPAMRVATRNNFPTGAGLASSASGFAALTLAVARVLDLDLSPEELSVRARMSGSGSAARSIPGGYVEWPPSDDGDLEGPARQIAPAEHWDLRNVIALVDSGEKEISSREGHERAGTSPHYRRRLQLVPERLSAVRGAIRDRDLPRLGPVLETEAVELHLVAMSSRPPIFYWSPGTLRVMEAVRALRSDEGIAAYFSIDAGPNVHVVCAPEEEERVVERMRELSPVEEVLRDRVGPGPRWAREHLL